MLPLLLTTGPREVPELLVSVQTISDMSVHCDDDVSMHIIYVHEINHIFVLII